MLDTLFNPRSIAIVGASRDTEKVGNIILRNIVKNTFSGKIYVVNNKADTVEGLKSYKSLTDIGENIDLMVITVPRDAVPSVMEEGGKLGIKSAIIITSGFKEVDEHGSELQDKVSAICNSYQIRYLGPNTLGMITPTFNATFALTDVKMGNVAVVAQSGGIGVYMLDWARKTRIGLSYFVSLGNEADINETDVFEFLSTDASTKAIFSYIEGIADGNRFLSIVPDIIGRKPIIFLKGGIGIKGAQAVKTHTASVAGSVDIFRAAIRTVGGIFVDTLEDLLNIAKIITSDEGIKKDLLIVTNSGGHGVLTTDEIERRSLNLISLPDAVVPELKKLLPSQSKPANPLDLSGDADRMRYKSALTAVQGLDCTKLVIVEALPMSSCVEIAKTLISFKGKGIVGVMMGLDEDAALRILESANMPAFQFPEDAVKAIKYFTDQVKPTKKIRVKQPVLEAEELISGKSYLRDFEAFKLLEIYGIRVPKWGIATSPEEAIKVAEQVGYPLVMKVSLDSPVHKTEMGGVLLGLQKGDINGAYSELSKKSSRVLLQKQINGAEIFLGGLKDPVFGPAVVTGVGGIYVEVLKSISYGLCPVSEDEAAFMLLHSKAQQLLSARGKSYNIDSAITTITRLSRLIIDLDIKEMDINPLIVNEDEALAIDPRIVLR
ncbi:MAG: acetate--CoA ligase family protein [Nitrososphaerota archaeon]|nr:acetate--CoA ligase family protein [Nitrososphaerota archaeon]